MRDTIVSVLAAANTTTADTDLSLSMTARVETIAVGDPDKTPVGEQELPAVRVQVADAGMTEEYTVISSRPPANIVDRFAIAVIATGADLEESTENTVRLARNVRKILRVNQTLNGYVEAITGMETSYDFKNSESVYQQRSDTIITVEAYART